MAELTAKARNKLPASKFGMPGARKYPMNNKSHAANAKARARQMLNKGRITRSQYDRIVAMANRVLGG